MFAVHGSEPPLSIDHVSYFKLAEDIRLCHDVYRFPGLKPYNPRVGLPYNSPLYDPWYEKGNEIGGFVKLHQTAVGDRFLDEVADIAGRYPNMNYLLAHSGWTWEVARSRVALARERPNVYLDLTFTSVLHGVVEYFVDEGLNPALGLTPGPDRFPWQAHARGLAGHMERRDGAHRRYEHAGPPARVLRPREWPQL